MQWETATPMGFLVCVRHNDQLLPELSTLLRGAVDATRVLRAHIFAFPVAHGGTCFGAGRWILRAW